MVNCVIIIFLYNYILVIKYRIYIISWFGLDKNRGVEFNIYSDIYMVLVF